MGNRGTITKIIFVILIFVVAFLSAKLHTEFEAATAQTRSLMVWSTTFGALAVLMLIRIKKFLDK